MKIYIETSFIKELLDSIEELDNKIDSYEKQMNDVYNLQCENTKLKKLVKTKEQIISKKSLELEDINKGER